MSGNSRLGGPSERAGTQAHDSGRKARIRRSGHDSRDDRSGHDKRGEHREQDVQGSRSKRLRIDKSREVDALIHQSEVAGSCLASTSQSLRRALDTRVRAGLLVSPAPRLYARSSLWESLTPARRALHIMRGLHALHPHWTFCRISAAVAWGLSVPYRTLGPIDVAVRRSSATRSTGLIRRHQFSDLEPCMAAGVPVTSLPRTTFDCLRTLSFQDGTAIGDSALRCPKLDAGQLADYVEAQRSGYAGAARARDTARFLDARSANGGESIARALMHELGFAAPDLQVAFADPLDPSHTHYVDYLWRIALGPRGQRYMALPDGTCDDRVIGELDGVEKIVDPDMNGGIGVRGALLRERRRESRLTITRAAVARFSYADVLRPAALDAILEAYGVPRDHAPLIRVPRMPVQPMALQAPFGEEVPPEVYGI